jgi:hypothetical protein
MKFCTRLQSQTREDAGVLLLAHYAESNGQTTRVSYNLSKFANRFQSRSEVSGTE